MLSSLIDILKAQKQKLYCAFVDFSQAFDSVWRCGLWCKLLLNSVKGKFFELIHSMYDNIKSCVKFNNECSTFFACKNGVRQGENLSPVLFAFYLNDLETYFLSAGIEPISLEYQNENILSYLKLLVLLYADDTVIFSNKECEFRNCLKAFHEYCLMWKLNVNYGKTKIIIFNKRYTNNPYFKLGEQEIELVDQYKYLGTLFNKSGSFIHAKKYASEQARKAMYLLFIKSFDIRISPLLESANIKPQNIEKHFTPNIPAWCMKPPEILFDLHSGKKSESNPHILKDDFRKMQSRYKNYQQIYTDGSKEDSKVGCAVISDNHSNMQRIPDDSSIFTAEAKAVDLALDFISTCDANNKFIIFSDSLSVLKAMNHTSSKNPQIQKLLEKCHELLTYKEIVLCWIPSHIGIQGNEMVDKQAKTSLSLEPTSFKIPFSNFKPSINKYILEEWQTSWNNSIGNKLLDIKPTIGEYQSVVRNIRREEVVLARLRLGHARVTHSYLLQGEEHPQCVGCDAPFTVRHFLLECGDFAQVRNNCFHVNNMKELFQDIHIDSIMTFLRQINLFNKI